MGFLFLYFIFLLPYNKICQQQTSANYIPVTVVKTQYELEHKSNLMYVNEKLRQ